MKLSDLLQAGSDWAPPSLPDLNSLKSATGRVLARWPNIVRPPRDLDREHIVKEIQRRFAKDSWDGTLMSLVCPGARALFDPEQRSRADLEELRQFYYRETACQHSPTFLNALLETYIESYEPKAAHTVSLAKALKENRGRLSARGARLLDQFPECLDPERAPGALAQRMAAMRNCWGELREMGISAPHSPGLMQHSHLAFIQLLKPRLTAPAGVEQLFAWLKPDGQRPLQTGAAAAIEAVLAPWQTVEPSQTLQNLLLQNLTDCYGDARLRRGDAWSGVSEDILAKTMYRWLTGKDIRFFLDVVSVVETSHMWQPRREFWEGLFRQKRISAAWVAFSPDAADYARKIARDTGNKAFLNFGAQIAGGSRSNTSLLILRSVDKIIVEGSHNYKVHIFHQQNQAAPKLYESRYDCERIRRSLYEQSTGSEAKRSHIGDWQGWVLERI